MNETPDAPLSDDDMTTDVGGVLPDSDPTDADGGDADGTDA